MSNNKTKYFTLEVFNNFDFTQVRLKIVMLLCLLSASGCGGTPPRIQMPSYDASGSASNAMDLFDANSDGVLDQQELAACPGLLTAINQFDEDQNSEISAAEITRRIDEWFEKKAAALSVRIRITMDGRPLGGARVEFVPEEFLGDATIAASGSTQASGMAQMIMDQDKVPESLSGIAGVLPGLYAVKITHPKKAIPKRYNDQTTLGVEVSYESADAGLQLDLKSK